MSRWFGGFSPPGQADCLREGSEADTLAQLFHRARDQRDQEAFCELVAQIVKPLLVNVARTMIDGDAVQDVVQETLLRAWLCLDELDSVEHLRAWCYRVARCRMIDTLRRTSVRPSPLSRVAPDHDLQTQVSDRHADPAEALGTDPYLGPALRKALAALPPTDQQLVRLYYFDELSTQEVADRVGMNRNTVKVRLLRARKKLQDHIQKHLYETMGRDAERVVIHRNGLRTRAQFRANAGVRTRPGLLPRQRDFRPPEKRGD